uniref:Uncharacterized protein n=1 Tax=Noccaea caerulescens TaxID=107243 RepID=A0A1J3KAI3_NOCCA
MSLSGESFVPATQESDGEDLKANVLKLVAIFRETLSDAKRFIHNTKVSKDEIRASIRCFNELVDNFHGGWDDFRAATKRGLPPLPPEGVRPQADDSEELSSDKLRLIAASLLKYFRKNVLKLFIMAFSPYVLISSDDDAKTALMVIKRSVEHNVNLVHRVMNEGFDGIDRDVDEDDDVDIWW